MAFADDFKRGVERAVRMVQLDRQAIAEAAEDPNALPVGVVIVALAGVSAGLGAIRGGMSAVLWTPVALVVGSFLMVGLFFVVGMLFKPPSWDFVPLYRALSHSYLLGWAGIARIIPFLGGLITGALALWQLVVMVVAIQTVGKTDIGKAILIVLIPMVVCCGLVALLVFGIGMSIAGLGFLGSMRP